MYKSYDHVCGVSVLLNRASSSVWFNDLKNDAIHCADNLTEQFIILQNIRINIRSIRKCAVDMYHRAKKSIKITATAVRTAPN